MPAKTINKHSSFSYVPFLSVGLDFYEVTQHIIWKYFNMKYILIFNIHDSDMNVL